MLTQANLNDVTLSPYRTAYFYKVIVAQLISVLAKTLATGLYRELYVSSTRVSRYSNCTCISQPSRAPHASSVSPPWTSSY
jgi:hypothetical protein